MTSPVSRGLPQELQEIFCQKLTFWGSFWKYLQNISTYLFHRWTDGYRCDPYLTPVHQRLKLLPGLQTVCLVPQFHIHLTHFFNWTHSHSNSNFGVTTLASSFCIWHFYLFQLNANSFHQWTHGYSLFEVHFEVLGWDCCLGKLLDS